MNNELIPKSNIIKYILLINMIGINTTEDSIKKLQHSDIVKLFFKNLLTYAPSILPIV